MPPEPLSPEAAAASKAAVHAQKEAAQAVEVARVTQMHAHDETTKNMLADALREVFGEYQDQQRFIDLKRIPLICKDIAGIHSNIGEIKEMMEQVKSDLDKKDEKNEAKYVTKDQFSPIKIVVFGLCGAILMAFTGALISLVFK